MKSLVYKAFCLLFFTQYCDAQFIKEKSIVAEVGFGFTVPYTSVDDIISDGFYAQGELVLRARSWVEFIPYAGIVTTN